MGIAASLLLGLNSTHALAAGVAVYGLCLLAVGLALYTQPTPTTPTAADTVLPGAQGQLA